MSSCARRSSGRAASRSRSTTASKRRPTTWKAYDVVIGGVSLVTNYRDEFNQQVQERRRRRPDQDACRSQQGRRRQMMAERHAGADPVRGFVPDGAGARWSLPRSAHVRGGRPRARPPRTRCRCRATASVDSRRHRRLRLGGGRRAGRARAARGSTKGARSASAGFPRDFARSRRSTASSELSPADRLRAAPRGVASRPSHRTLHDRRRRIRRGRPPLRPRAGALRREPRGRARASSSACSARTARARRR